MRKTIPQNKHKKPNHFHRKLHFGDEVWSWQLACNGVYIRHPDGLKTTFVTNAKMGIEEIEVENEDEGEVYECLDGISPSNIKNYIETHLHPNTAKRQEPEVIRKR
jgi:hypothetical protein